MRIGKDNLVMVGIFAGLVLAYFAVVYRLQSKWLEQAADQLAQRKRQIETDAVSAARVAPLAQEVEEMKQRYNKDWDRRLPKSKELAEFLREISGNLAQENLGNQLTKTGTPNRGNLFNRMPITMSFEGDFLALGRFLQRVDSMTRLTRIEQLTIEPKKDAGSALAVELGMNIYFTEY